MNKEDAIVNLLLIRGAYIDTPVTKEQIQLINDTFDMAIEALKQEPKTGHWKVVGDGYGDNAYICECSKCKDTVWVYKDADRRWNYCPTCGAKMAESEGKYGTL